MRDNISPEEKLLRLIKSQRKKPANIPDDKNNPAAGHSGLKPQQAVLSSFPAFKNFFLKSGLNKIILIAFISGGIYLVYSFAYPWFAFKKVLLPQVSAKKADQIKFEFDQGRKPVEFYQQGITGRRIFGAAAKTSAGAAAGAVNVDLTKDINLVGIISGENPQAVIEDVKTKKTSYVTKGQFIGEFQVEDIREGKIIINYKGQSYELYL